MSEMTYTKCSLCLGALKSVKLGNIRCPCNDTESPGYEPTTFSLAEIHRLHAADKKRRREDGLVEWKPPE